MAPHCALIAYPLSHQFQKKLENALQVSIDSILLTELRMQPFNSIWKRLRACKSQKFFIPIEDQQAKVLLPILFIIAKIASPSQIVVIDQNFNLKKITNFEILGSCLKLLVATVQVNLFYYVTKLSIKRLLRERKELPKVVECLSQPKKILYLNTNLWFGVKAGGSVGHIAGIANALAQKKCTIDYAAVEYSSVLDASVRYLPLPAIKRFGLPAVLNYYQYNQQVHRYILKHNDRWDFIYQRMSIANFSGVTIARSLKIPLVLEYNGSEVWVAKNWANRRPHRAPLQAEQACLASADLIVTVSAVLKEELISRGVSPEKIVCYPNCIDPRRFDPERFSKLDRLQLRSQYAISPESVVITFVGTFGQWHGVSVLAEAIKILIQQAEPWLKDHQVHFMLVGDGMLMSAVRKILADALQSSYITLTGIIPQEQAPAYLATSDILLSPHVPNPDGSRFFGSPTKLFEYMAMGKAIIASDLEQIGEVLKPSLNINNLPCHEPSENNQALALLCEPGNIQQLNKAIQFLVENPAWREVLGKNARKEALTKYTWEKHVEAFLSKFSSD